MLLNEKNWTETDKKLVWNKGKVVMGYDPNVLRQDIAGAWMQYDMYGDTENELGFGWEIDHIKPEIQNGNNAVDNLQPLQWLNNRSKGDGYPLFNTLITSLYDENINQEKIWNYTNENINNL